MVRYSGVGSDNIESDVNHLVNDQLINGEVSSSLSSSRFSGKHIFVCTHAARDERCGIYGPGMITKLSEQLIKQGHEDVTVYSASHVGGHKFAGCLLAYPEGDWYGLLNADLMENFVDHIIIGGEEPHEKPHPSIFQKALGLAVLNSKEVIHVGDSYEADIKGASSVGIKSVWVNNECSRERLAKGNADFVIKSVLELPVIISKIDKGNNDQ